MEEAFDPAEIKLGLLIAFLLIMFLGIVYFIWHSFYPRFSLLKKLPREELKRVLNLYIPYYRSLSSKNKVRFENKTFHFLEIKEFIPRQMTEVTSEMKILIAACFVMVTFGFPDITLEHFKRILVYPDAYYSTINRRYHKGEVNPAGQLIVLSWKSFVEGFIHPTDSINLGLHEIAHALRLENKIRNNEYSFLEPELMKKWLTLSEKVINDIRNGRNSFFRKYAEVNEDEFFAVAIENFFERPGEFNKNHPELYALMKSLLKQDPLNL